MPEINLDSLTFKLFSLENNHNEIQVFSNSTNICTGRYYKSKESITLTWIETAESMQGRGVASKVLDYFWETALSEHLNFKIKVVNEELLTYFYFKWFQKKVDPENQYNDEVKDKFNELTTQDSLLTLEFTPEHLVWKPEHDQNNLKM
ncbi:MAG: hypothetical protein PSV35_08940 [bacterium]|nr:hypothetical protein [bacterium]